MADPTKVPGDTGPNNPLGNRNLGPNDGRVIPNRRNYSWAWIVAIVVILLIIWAFFGMNRTRVVTPVSAPVPATSTAR